jgi:hypothetical protein
MILLLWVVLAVEPLKQWMYHGGQWPQLMGIASFPDRKETTLITFFALGFQYG